MECKNCKLIFVNNGSLIKHEKSCKLTTDIILNIINDYKFNFLSIKDLQIKYNSCNNIIRKILGNNIRNNILARKNSIKPKFKHTLESKQKLRNKRLEWMKNNPDKTAWRLKNLSYPEKIFNDQIIKYKLHENYVIIRERSFFPYFIDYAFENEKIAIEIDGSQHNLAERKIKDQIKDEILNKNGWKVIRISAYSLINNTNDIMFNIIKLLKNSKSNDIKNYRFGIFKNKVIDKVQKINGKTNKQLKHYINTRKIKRPDYMTLLNDIKELNYTGTGKKYGVSDNSIRKWIVSYEKYNQ